MTFIKRLFNFPKDLFLLLYTGEDKTDLSLTRFLIIITFVLLVYFWFTRTQQTFPPYIWEVLSTLLIAELGVRGVGAFKQTGGLTINRHIYGGLPTQTGQEILHTTNTIPNQNQPANTIKPVSSGGKSQHVEGNPEEEV